MFMNLNLVLIIMMIKNSLSVYGFNETGCLEFTMDENNVMTDHYVTITGVFIDNQSGRTWLRVQSWGGEWYLDFDEFYNYSNDNAESFINRDGAIIVIG